MNTAILFLSAIFLGCCQGYGYSHDDYGHLQYHGPTAIPHVLKDGYLADTHEVAVAKAEHFAAVAKAKSYGGYGYGDHGYGDYGYGSYGYGDHEYGQGYGQGHEYSYDNHGHFLYHGPTAIPHVLKDGHIADTHEVAVAKAEHFAAVAKARVHYYGGYGGGYNEGYSGGYASGYSGGYAGKYHGPLAKPVVLKSGYLADTHEVAAAKDRHIHALHKAGSYGHHSY